jgi:pectate lyase
MSRFLAVAACFCVLAACNGVGLSTNHDDGSVSPADVSSGGAGGSAAGGSAAGGTTGVGVSTGGTAASGSAIATGGATSAAGGIAGNLTGGTFGSGGLATGGAFAGTGGKAAGTGGSASGGMPGGGGMGSGGSATGGKSTGTGGAAGAATGGVMGTGGTSTGGARTGGTGAGTGGVGSGGSATGGISGTGGSSVGNCTVPPDASALVGWASQSGNGVTTTTGGGSATSTTVTNLAALQAAVKGSTAAVIYVKGVMAAGVVTIGSNKTIAGICGAEIHGHVEMSGSVNVIIRNIKIVGYAVGNCALDPSYDSSVGCSSGDDAISLQQNAHHVWFDHCDISDGTDGNLDITKGADFVTVSWTKFHYTARTDGSGSDSTGASGHRFSNLVGGDDGTTSDAGKLNITWHHNWWADNVVERQPRVRYGKNHVVNNLYTSTSSSYCVRAGIEAQILVENNVFVGVKNPQEFNGTTDQSTATITSKGNLYSGTSGSQSTGGGGTPFTTPPYSYTADATTGLQASIESGAGPK